MSHDAPRDTLGYLSLLVFGFCLRFVFFSSIFLGQRLCAAQVDEGRGFYGEGGGAYDSLGLHASVVGWSFSFNQRGRSAN